jgi:HEAT repeat protein
MQKPTLEGYFVFTLLAAGVGATAGGIVQALGGPWLVVFGVATLVASFGYMVGLDLRKDHPLSWLMGPPLLALGAGNIVAWIAWTNARPPIFLGNSLGFAMGLAGFAVGAPGFLRRRYLKSLTRADSPPQGGRLAGRMAVGAALLALLALITWGLMHTSFGRINYYCLLRDYGGVRAASDFIDALGDGSLEVRSIAAGGLRKIGPPAVPALLTAIDDPRREVREKVGQLLEELRPMAVDELVRQVRGRDPRLRRAAMGQLKPLGAKAARAVDALIGLLEDADAPSRAEAASTLAAIGPEAGAAVAVLVKALADPDAEVRRSAADALGGIGPQAKPATAALARFTREEPERAARALGRIGPGAKQAAPVLVDLLRNSQTDVRLQAAKALGAIAPADQATTLALLDSRRDPQAAVSREAAAALRRVSPRHARLADALTDVEAAQMLRYTLDPSDKANVSLLRDIFQHGDPTVRARAVNALGNLGADAVPVLMEALADAEGEVWQRAATTLARVGQPAVGPLQALLGKDRQSLRARAALALVDFGPAASAALPALRVCLQDSYPCARLYAAEALWKAGRDAAGVPVLAGFLQDPDVFFRRYSASTLAAMGAAAGPAVLGLRAAVDDKDAKVRLSAIQALAAIGPAAAPAVAELCRAAREAKSEDAQTEVRLAAIDALGRIGTAAHDASSLLVNLVGEEDPRVVGAAAAALPAVAVEPKAAVRALREALENGKFQVVRPSSVSLREMERHFAPDPMEASIGQARVEIIRALGSFGPAAAQSVPSLVQAGQRGGTDPGNSPAFAALAKIDPGFKATVRFLIADLEKPDDRDRGGTFRWIAALGPQAQDAVPKTLAFLDGQSFMLGGDEAIKALAAIGPAAKAAVPRLVQMARDPHAWHRPQVVAALACICPNDPKFFTLLLELLQDKKDDELRSAAIDALGRIGPEAGDPSPPLIGLLEADAAGQSADAAIGSLGKLGPRAKAAVPALERILHDKQKSAWRRSHAAVALWRIDGNVAPRVAAVLEAADSVLDTGHLAGDLTPMGPAAVPALEQAIEAGGKREGRHVAVVVLGQIGPPAKAAVPALVAALKDPEPLTREAAAEALGRIGPAAHEAIPALQQAARQWAPRESLMGIYVEHPALDAAEALARIDPQAAVPLLDLLITEATGDHPAVAAIRILGEMGPLAKRAVPSLLQVSRKTEEQLRQIESNRVMRRWSGLHDDATWRPHELEELESTTADALRKIDPQAF